VGSGSVPNGATSGMVPRSIVSECVTGVVVVIVAVAIFVSAKAKD
jgi:hypothetical protein